MTNLVLVAGNYGPERTVLFAKPGEYNVRVRYVYLGKTVAESNALRFNVEEPTGDEAAAYDAIRDRPGALAGSGQDLAAFLRQFPRSRYGRYAQLRQLRERLGRATSGVVVAPAPNGIVRVKDPDAFRLRESNAALEDLAKGDWGPFAEEAAVLEIEFSHLKGDHEGARRLTAEFVRRYPESRAAERYRAALTASP